jgi:hypothetical protein
MRELRKDNDNRLIAENGLNMLERDISYQKRFDDFNNKKYEAKQRTILENYNYNVRGPLLQRKFYEEAKTKEYADMRDSLIENQN